MKEVIDVYQLKATLLWVRPKVIRVIIVPATWSLSDLHVGLSDTMSWNSSLHLEEFCSIENSYDRVGVGDDELDDEYQEIMKRIRLTDVFSTTKKILWRYSYDNDWEHVVELEKKLVFRRDMVPCCIDGVNASPPEEIGGPDEYRRFSRAMAKATHRRHATEVLRFGRVFNVGEFDPDSVVMSSSALEHA